MRWPYLDPWTKDAQYSDFLRPLTVNSGKLSRPISPTNSYPGEGDRAAAVVAGKDPGRSKVFKTLQIHARGEAWLGQQMLQTSTKTPHLDPSYMVPNWA
eukprot:8880147-Pyramimonas_sp.AAC.1